jgi:hypothetical protein
MLLSPSGISIPPAIEGICLLILVTQVIVQLYVTSVTVDLCNRNGLPKKSPPFKGGLQLLKTAIHGDFSRYTPKNWVKFL